MNKTTTQHLKNFLNELIEDNKLTVVNGKIRYQDDEIQSRLFDERGFYAIESELGGRKISKGYELLEQFSKSIDSVKRKVADTTPRLVIVNKDLTEEQYKLFITNNEKYFLIHSMNEKSISANQKENGAFIIFEAIDENGKTIKDHLVAVGGNSAMTKSKGYEDYLNKVDNALVRYIWNKYERLNSKW